MRPVISPRAVATAAIGAFLAQMPASSALTPEEASRILQCASLLGEAVEACLTGGEGRK